MSVPVQMDDDLNGLNEIADSLYRAHAFATAAMVTETVVEDIQHHFEKFGAQRLDDGNWLKVIIEEEGEAVEQINKMNWVEAKKETMQVIACWIRLFIEIERMERGLAESERDRYGRAS